MNTELDEQTWGELERHLPRFGMLNARRISWEPKFLIAVDHEGYRHGLFALTSLEQAVTDNRSRGLNVTGRTLVVDGEAEGPYLDVKCTDRESNKAFNMVLAEIMQMLTVGFEPRQAVISTLSRWRRFWASVPNQALNEEQVKGLFGELWFLCTWLFQFGMENVLHWVGPTGVRHDFQWPGMSVEVKTTSSIRGHVHWISGLDQLDPPEHGQLYLYSLRVRQEANATNSLPVLINAIVRMLSDRPDLLDVFEQRLIQAGYSPVHIDDYSEIRFRIVSERLFVVGESFPKITVQSFRDGIPTGVERVEYEVNLEGVWNCCVSTTPQDIGVDFRPR